MHAGSSGQCRPALTLRQTLTYASPTIATSFLIGPLAIVQGIYAKYFGLPLTTIATVLLVARIFDAVTDPLIGYYSDRYYARTGSRKPFILVGGVLLVISGYFLYSPVDWETLTTLDQGRTSITANAHYFLGWFLLFYFAWTLFEIPHMAWASDLADSSTEKSRIYSVRYAVTTIGLLVFYAIPLLPIFSTNEFTPTTLYWSAILAACLMLPSLYLCIKSTPDSAMPPPIAKSQKTSTKWKDIQSLAKETRANKPLLLFLCALALVSIGIPGMWFTLIFIYADAYLELGNDFALASLIAPCIGLLFIGAWYLLAIRLGKKVTLALAMLCSAVGMVITGLLSPGDAGFTSLLLVMILCYGMGATANGALSPSLLADITDYHTWKFGRDRTATYFSLYTLIAKISLAIGGALGLGIAGAYGFEPAADVYTPESIVGLRLAIAWLPTGFVFCSIILFLINPLTTRRHTLVRKRLAIRYGKP